LDIHLDPLGGLSGDMFVSALLDAFPEHWPQVQAAIASLDLGPAAECQLVSHHDHSFAGSRFLVRAEQPGPELEERSPHAAGHHESLHAHERGGHHGHTSIPHRHAGHKAWASIRADLAGSGLDSEVKRRALAIFERLAQAEARVHGVPVESVTFHEVGAVDSIVDIVAAAQLIALIRADRWTSAPLPLGSGRIMSAHGVLPVPAPATAILLQGLPVIDDGVPGERVTPTGAALAAYLIDPHAPPDRRARRIARTGVGFGARTLPGVSNCVRVLAFDDATTAPLDEVGRRQLAVVTFEVDDQSPEDLAIGLDHIRALNGVFDVTQNSVAGKKGRVAAHVQVLAEPGALDNVIVACFEETTTIGLRHQLTEGAILRRRLEAVDVEGERVQVKIVDRPGGAPSGKAEAADVAAHRGQARRARLRRKAAAVALGTAGGGDDTEQGL